MKVLGAADEIIPPPVLLVCVCALWPADVMIVLAVAAAKRHYRCTWVELEENNANQQNKSALGNRDRR